MNKKVLLISYYFNQRNMTGSSFRLKGLVNYLPVFGWEPTVLTVKSDENNSEDFRIIETDYEDLITKWRNFLRIRADESVNEKLNVQSSNKRIFLNKLIDLWREIFAYPDEKKYWLKFAVESGIELLESEKFDAIISSSSPVTSHLIAHELKNKYDIPWIADLRDLWTQNHYHKHSIIRKYFEQKLEIKTLSNADLLTTVSKPLAEKLKKFHNKEVYIILNGFNPIIDNLNVALKPKFNIVYTGSIYNKKMDPQPFFKALSQLISEGIIKKEDIEVNFYGSDGYWLTELVKENNLEDFIELHGWIDREDILRKQKEAQLLLLLNWNDPKEKGVYTGKIFEYLGAMRPIISIGTYGGVIGDLLNDTNAGVNLNTIGEIKKELLRAYIEFKKYDEVKYNGIKDEVNKYSHKEMVKKFSKLLENITN